MSELVKDPCCCKCPSYCRKCAHVIHLRLSFGEGPPCKFGNAQYDVKQYFDPYSSDWSCSWHGEYEEYYPAPTDPPDWSGRSGAGKWMTDIWCTYYRNGDGSIDYTRPMWVMQCEINVYDKPYDISVLPHRRLSVQYSSFWQLDNDPLKNCPSGLIIRPLTETFSHYWIYDDLTDEVYDDGPCDSSPDAITLTPDYEAVP